MPAKYRKMADFHEYYSGARRAPYLTIFIGGNHEASNHLFELYYGGWVAPNMYYMGAANIIRLGPLRIAGLSGIWKGYDYRKPHFERVPYNEGEKVSIFHVRELDVRKLLSVRTQVDIGLSHDWPQGIEWKGDYRSLFRKKDRFEADANEGRLGSVAARQCLDRLRPSHWFSAHLHIKYAAVLNHGDYERVRPPQEHRPRHGALIAPPSDRANKEHKNETASNISDTYTSSSFQDDRPSQSSYNLGRPTNETSSPSTSLPIAISNHKAVATPKTPQQAQVSAWQNFHVDANKAEAKDSEMRLREQTERAAEEYRSGTRGTSPYIFDETWKQVQVDDGVERGIASVSKTIRSPGEDVRVSSVDGCIESKLKRPRSMTPEEVKKDGQTTAPPTLSNGLPGQLDGQVPVSAITGPSAIRNVDEIDIDLTDSSSEDAGHGRELSLSNSTKKVPASAEDGVCSQATREKSNKRAKSQAVMSDDSDEGGVKLGPTSAPFVPRATASLQPSTLEEQVKEEASAKTDTIEGDREEVSDTMRAQLAELSQGFAPVSCRQQSSAPLPLPENIVNITTHFLALDKCERGRNFLQLLEVEPISEQLHNSGVRPYKLQYDKEWLAILRAFAPELELGGDPTSRTPQHKGDTHYRERIMEEEKWIEEHVVKLGKLTVPENFTVTAPVYDHNEQNSIADEPHEYTNPQTSEFCRLIGIENKFDISEEEREGRMAQGLRPAGKNFARGNRDGGRGGRGGSFSARGRGGGGRGHGGRGRGRGRGRGGW
jgi:lariat debranching enzyme